jgi:hypothetical protein
MVHQDQHGLTSEDHPDVEISSLSDAQLLQYEQASGKWKNKDVAPTGHTEFGTDAPFNLQRHDLYATYYCWSVLKWEDINGANGLYWISKTANSNAGLDITFDGTYMFPKMEPGTGVGHVVRMFPSLIVPSSGAKTLYFFGIFAVNYNNLNSTNFLWGFTGTEAYNGARVWFRLQGVNGDTHISAETGTGATSTVEDCGVLPAKGEMFSLMIEYKPSASAKFYINGELKKTITTNLPGLPQNTWIHMWYVKNPPAGNANKLFFQLPVICAMEK